MIPPRPDRTDPRASDAERDRDRSRVERSGGPAEPVRRAAARYEETARTVLAFVHRASIMIRPR